MTHLINIFISCKLSSIFCFLFLWKLPSAMFELHCFGCRNCSKQKSGPNYGLTSLCPSSRKAKGPWISLVLEAFQLLQSNILLNFLPLSSRAQHSTHHTGHLLSHHSGVDLKSPPKASGMKTHVWTLAWYCGKKVKPFNRWNLVRCSRSPEAYVLEEDCGTAVCFSFSCPASCVCVFVAQEAQNNEAKWSQTESSRLGAQINFFLYKLICLRYLCVVYTSMLTRNKNGPHTIKASIWPTGTNWSL